MRRYILSAPESGADVLLALSAFCLLIRKLGNGEKTFAWPGASGPAALFLLV